MVPLLKFFEDGGHLCLVMPRYTGSVLDAIRKAKGPLDEPTALKIAVDLFNGLQGLHARRIVHRVGLCHELLFVCSTALANTQHLFLRVCICS